MIVGISGKKQSGKNTVALIWQYLYDYYSNNYTYPITVEDFKEYVKNNDHLKSVWIQKSFAHKIKQITCILLGCTMEQLEDPIFKETPLGEEWWVWVYYEEPTTWDRTLTIHEEIAKRNDTSGMAKQRKLTPRMLMQMLGTEFGRDMVHPNLWVNSLFSEYLPKKLSIGIDKYGVQTIIDKYPSWVITDVRFFNEVKAIKDREGILIRVNRDSDSKDSHVSENELITYKDWDYVIDNNYSLSELILRVRQIMFKEGIIYE